MAACDDWKRGEAGVWLKRTGSTRLPKVDVAPVYAVQIKGDWQGAARMWLDLGCPFDAAMALNDADDESALRDALRAFDDLGAVAAAPGAPMPRSPSGCSFRCGPSTITCPRCSPSSGCEPATRRLRKRRCSDWLVPPEQVPPEHVPHTDKYDAHCLRYRVNEGQGKPGASPVASWLRAGTCRRGRLARLRR